MRAIILGCDIYAVGVEQEILCAHQGISEGFVGFIDTRGQSFSFRFLFLGKLVGMKVALKLKEFASKQGEVNVEWTSRRRTKRGGSWKYSVVG